MRASPGDRSDHWPKAHFFCRLGYRGEPDPRIRDLRDRGLVLEVIPQEDSIPACLFGRDGNLDNRPWVGEGAEGRKVESVFHQLATNHQNRASVANPSIRTVEAWRVTGGLRERSGVAVTFLQ